MVYDRDYEDTVRVLEICTFTNSFCGRRKTTLADWEKMIGEKLQILDELYERVDDRVRTAQSQTLEVIIVALIVIELLLAVFRHN